MSTFISIKRKLRLIAVRFNLIKNGNTLWYYYLPTDEIIDESINKSKPYDVVKRGNKFGVKPKNSDKLHGGFYETKKIAQTFVDMGAKQELFRKYLKGDMWLFNS